MTEDFESFKDYDFTTLKGVGKSVADKIAEGYTGWPELKKLSVKKIAEKVPGVSPRIASELKKLAKDQFEINDPRHTANQRKTSTEVKEEIASAAAVAEAENDTVLVAKRVDQFSVIRREVERHPAICAQCGFDLLERNHLPDWGMLDPRTQDELRASMQEHILKAHKNPHLSEVQRTLQKIKAQAEVSA